MKFCRTLIVTTKAGNVYKSEIEADNSSISVYRNGYSNWDGKRNIAGFTVKFTDNNGKEDTAFATTRKEAILEAAYRITPHKEHRHGLTYKLVK